MAYTTFSTDNADYVLQLGNHKFRNKQVDIFEGIDALVIETGKSRFKEIVEHGHQQYDLPLKHCLENSIPIFGTDVRGTSSGYQRNLFSNTITGFPTWIPLAYYGLSEKRINSLMLSIFANYSFLIQDNRNEGRNAIIARKIEEFVVPLMAGRERKPSIGLIFGAAHMGIKTKLQSKRMGNPDLHSKSL